MFLKKWCVLSLKIASIGLFFSGLVTCRKPNVCRGAVQEVLSWSSKER